MYKKVFTETQFSFKKTLIIALLMLLLGVLLGATFYKETIVVREGTADTPAAMTSVNLMIDEGNGTVKTWNTVSWHEAMSVLDLLEAVAATKNITLLTANNAAKQEAVTTINGITNDTREGKRWQYWVNNTYEPRVASKYYLKPGDIVVWKYVKEQNVENSK